MKNNGAIETFEVERKYEVLGEEAVPGAEAFARLGLRLADAEHHELRASYFDTEEGALASQRIAVRRREGGKDEGWHMKLKGDDGARELLWPRGDRMPEGLRREIEDRIGAEELERISTIATLRTLRVTALLVDAGGEPVVELADDRVSARNELSGAAQQWREWEAELMPGADPDLLERIEPLLTAAGAKRVRGTSKIQRAMRL